MLCIPSCVVYPLCSVDLNRIMPGKRAGTASQQFAFHFLARVIKHVDYLLDLHT